MTAHTLAALAAAGDALPHVKKEDLRPGDHVILRTANSEYHLQAAGGGTYVVCGGWFRKKGLDGVRVRVTGSTFGGSAVRTDLLAACGLCVEFGNRVVTSRVKTIVVLGAALSN
jgi:hypothetical protein